MSEKCQQETHALQQLATSCGRFVGAGQKHRQKSRDRSNFDSDQRQAKAERSAIKNFLEGKGRN
jgi:hypothetical protein